MKQTLLPVILLLLSPAVVLAHAGEHKQGLISTIGHLIAEPDHAIVLGMAAVLSVGAYIFVKKRKAQTERQ
ncbi:MAG: hypothetical protein Q8Q20_02525 [bacterium]|nr:hypothetical protein [bacterium]